MKVNLQPQDLVIALKLGGYPNARPSISVVASYLGPRQSEVHRAIQRLRSSRLIHGAALNGKPNISALEEFLVHGLKDAFPLNKEE